MKISREIITAVIIFVFVNSTAFSQHHNINKPYDYPIKPGTKEWGKFQTQDDMIKACQLPDDVLYNLTTEALVVTCLEYPLLPQINAYNNVQFGFDRLASKFNGFSELLSRQDSYIELFKVYKNMNPSGFSKDWSLLQQGRFIQKFQFIEMFLAQQVIISSLDLESKRELLQETNEKYRIKFMHQDLYSAVGLSHTSYIMVNALDSDDIGKNLLNSNAIIYEFKNSAVMIDVSILDQINVLVEAYLKSDK